jgi:two-component system sensor histidine kinase FlrB
MEIAQDAAGAALMEPADAHTGRASFECSTTAAEASLLARAFSEFIAAASRLEHSYSELQEQVAQLGLELAERNAALQASLADNERMRVALEQIVDSMPCGVMVLEKDGALSMVNPESSRLLDLGASTTHMLASLASISAHCGIDFCAFVEDLAAAESEQEFCLSGAQCKRWIEVRTRRLYAGHDEQGWDQTILILRDITAHKQAEQERERGRRATALAEVAAMLAHEIRNPLASMELFAGLLSGSDAVAGSSGPESTWVSHMRAGIRSLSGTVNNVLSFQGVAFPAREPLHVAAAIESSVEFVRPIAAQSGVVLECRAECGEAMVLGNASALQQLVLNLVANAVRHTPKGGYVCVSVKSGGVGRVRIECSDNGAGIPKEQLGEVFRAGFSGSGNTSGLGLAVCSHIVRQHEGEIGVTSAPSQGSTFYVELPAL